MLTFKKTFEDAKTVFQDAVDQRETFIHNLLAVFQADRLRPVGLITALNNLATAQDDFDAAEKEMLRLEHIEHVTDEIVDPFPPRIAEKLRSIGIDAAAQRELANEMLADANGGPEAMRALHENARLADKPADDRVRRWLEGDWTIDEPAEMPDAPWLKADIGCGEVEYQPGGARPSLHGDGHVGPVAQHAKQLAELEIPPQILAMMAVHDALEILDDRVRYFGERRPGKSPDLAAPYGSQRKLTTDERIAAMRAFLGAEVEAAWKEDDE